MSFVQDFDFPFATIEKSSPNWRFASETDDRAAWEDRIRADGVGGSDAWKTTEGRRQWWQAERARGTKS